MPKIRHYLETWENYWWEYKNTLLWKTFWQFFFSYKMNNMPIPRNSTSVYLDKRDEDITPQEDVYKYVN